MSHSKKDICFIINPVSGDLEKSELIEELKKSFGEPEVKDRIFYTKKSGNPEMIRKILKEIRPRTMVVAGGDGTINLVAREILNSGTRLGIIPAGSANGLATELGVPENIKEAINLVKTGKTKKIDTLKINNDYSFHLSDFGLNANVIRRFEEDPQRGFWAYAKHFLAEIFKIRSHEYIIELPKERFRTKASMLFIANARKFGTGALINPGGEIDDGSFEIIIVKAYKRSQLWGKLPKFLRGKIEHIKFIDVRSTQKAKIINPKNRTFQIDGELAGRPDAVEIEILPASLSVIGK
ncbi:MAG: diacylglycerol kinase family protein [Bacteroidota bacterium]|nr:diacylglycerol kinase family protein [Bacteroidota bacterium]